jgi:two-component system chemotaxis response regulator CheB
MSADSHQTRPRAEFQVVAVVSSLGGLEAFSRILSALPDRFLTPIVFLQHRQGTDGESPLQMLAKATKRPVEWAEEGGRLRPGTVHSAAGDRHLGFQPDGTFSVLRTDRVNFVRPAADVLLRSLALTFGRAAIAVVLTGRGSDGAHGCRVVRQQGGVVIAQDPATCRAWGMPAAAHDAGATDLVLPLEHIAPALTSLVMIRGAAEHLLGARAAAPARPVARAEPQS